MSSNTDFDFDIDSILAEFSSDPDESHAPAPQAARPRAEGLRQPVYVPAARENEPWADIQLNPAPNEPMPNTYTPRENFDSTRLFSAQTNTAAPPVRPNTVKTPSSLAKFDSEKFTGVTKKTKKDAKSSKTEPTNRPGFMNYLIGAVFAAVTVLCLAWAAVNVHPDAGISVSDASSARLDLIKKLDAYGNNAKSDALGDLTYIKKIYTIDESATVAPKPDPSRFGVTDDVNVIQQLIVDSAPLLEGQKLIWNPDADFVPGSSFRYYHDDTILVIVWQEFIDNKCCTCAEVKIAHGSQIRRKLADDTYSSPNQYYASDMSKQCNAVITINGDYYLFRNLGITVYQRQVFRNNPATVDTCFFNSSGDMIFSRAGELMNESDTWQFIGDNDIVFALAFGPVLVRDGELQYCASYPIGEIDTEYSRSSISQVDTLHYFLMTINHTMEGTPRANINELAEILYNKGVKNAYALDGGQTSEIIMQGEPVNHVDFGKERIVSDILYFATAIPESEVAQ